MAALIAMAVWLRTPLPALREQLKALQFWSLEICLAAVLAFGSLVVRDLWLRLHRGDVIRMASLAVAALALTLFVAPRTNRIYYDEQIYQSIGRNLSDLKLAQMCNDGTVEYGRLQCWMGEYNKQPYAYPHLLSLLYRAFGVSEAVAFVCNAVINALTVAAVYLLVVILFADRAAAFFASLLMLLTPQQLLWSATAAVEPSASLACVAAVLCAAAFRDSRTTVSLVATCAAAAYAAQFRPESFLIVPVVGLMLWPPASREMGGTRVWTVALLFFVLIAVDVAHMYVVRNEGWGTTDARLSFGYVLANLRVNGRFYLGDGRFPLVFTLLAIVGLLGASRQSERWCLGVYFFLFFGIFLLFYAGSYNYGADVRYSLMTYPPIAMLGGLGASALVAWLARIRPRWPATASLTGLLVFQFLWYAPAVRATSEEAWAARTDVRFAKSMVPQLSGNSYVLTHNPGMFHVWGVNAGQMSLIVTNPDHVKFLAGRYAEGVYLHWNFWCNVQDPVQRGFCQKALEGRPVEIVREYRERDQRYAFYRFRIGPPQN